MDWNAVSAIAGSVSAVASIATVVGIILVKKQIELTEHELKYTKEQAKTQFADDLAKEYREIIKEIPVKAFFDGAKPENKLSDEEYRNAFDDFYRYFDLTNQQIFLRQVDRVNFKTWEQWRDGIESQLKRTAFSQAWEEIKVEAPNDFEELQIVELQKFKIDPASWTEPTSELLKALRHSHNSYHALKP